MGFSENLVLSALADDAFVLTNKKLMRYLKGDGSAAVLLSEFISAHKYHMNNGSSDPDGAFEATIHRFEYSLGMSSGKQSRIIEALENAGLLKCDVRGFPQKRHVILDFDQIAKVLAEDQVAIKKAEKANFYEELNQTLQAALESPDSNLHIEVDHACDNMGRVLKGAIAVLSYGWISNGKQLSWNTEIVGRLRSWLGRRGYDKPFDYTLITRAFPLLDLSKRSDFKQYILQFLQTSKSVPEVHFSDQVYDYLQLIPIQKGN